MEIVNPKSSYPIGAQLEDISGVPMRGVPEKQGVSFSAHGWRQYRDGGGINADDLGLAYRSQSRPLSKPMLYRAKIEYAQRRPSDFPRYFIIEPTALCNRRCPFCSILVTNRTGMMKLIDFAKLMDECRHHEVYGLSLYQLGEPFLWRESFEDIDYDSGEVTRGKYDISAMVNLSKNLGGFHVVNLSTNGDVSNLDCILGSKLDDLIISIDGTTPEVYDANRPSTRPNDVDAFQRTIKRVRDFLDKKVSGGHDKPWVRLQIINKDNTANQVLDFVRYWIEVPGVDDVLVKHLDSMRPWLGDKIVSDDEDAIKAAALGAMPCQHIYAVGSMTADGRFNACCHDARTELTTAGANIDEMTFAEWWNGDYMRQMRQSHERGSFHPVCAQCRERDTWLG